MTFQQQEQQMDFPELTEEEEIRDIFFGIINRFIGFYTRDSQKYSKNDTANEYPFVPMDTRQLFDQLRFAAKYLKEYAPQKTPFTLLDIGCGIGNVMLFAEQMEFDVFGFEKDEYPLQIARKLMGSDRAIQGDLWQYDDYVRFDVIYYFRPLANGDDERRFERMIEDRMRTGSLLIANRKMSEDIFADSRFEKLSDNLPVWRKIAA
ncbi:MAG: class I SAM-dependent methyltransferase [Proteobacteria bacterium]|nr:class I SAM-dependent methyltransferase [Pseudomonadota bacterium]MBU4295605.1 class I SAM-dependent methyltransferase [Pseudomonadota bacterium]